MTIFFIWTLHVSEYSEILMNIKSTWIFIHVTISELFLYETWKLQRFSVIRVFIFSETKVLNNKKIIWVSLEVFFRKQWFINNLKFKIIFNYRYILCQVIHLEKWLILGSLYSPPFSENRWDKGRTFVIILPDFFKIN